MSHPNQTPAAARRPPDLWSHLLSSPAVAPTGAATTFAELGVPDAIAGRLTQRGITDAFPIQVATLADALAGRDICGRAPTGSGKTIAFGIPLVAGVSQAKPRHPRGLVLVPTRELATQVAEELTALAGPKGPSVATFFGGVGFGKQLKALAHGVDIAVACPGRLADLVQQGEIHLDAATMVVLDEADRMADMGFLPEVKRLLDRTPDDRQTLLFSATLDGDVNVLIKRYQHNPARHEHVVADDAPSNRHEFWKVERPERLGVTARVVTAEWPTIVFCRTRRGADRLAKQLAREGVSAAAIHGDRSQGQRERALAQFTSGKVQALVATDVAARGIHVDEVACVVHFDVPADQKDYVHRSGRTGRAGRTGLVVSLVPAEQVNDVRKIQRSLGLRQGVGAPDLDVLGPVRAAPKPAPERTDDRPQRNRQGGRGSANKGQGGNGGGRGGNGGGQRGNGQGRGGKRPGQSARARAAKRAKQG
ncbi:MAG: DEAD/DEAH box helicase [Acidimicrobiales bacterium]|nr:DEAD/DEAH box helicase [Acidimicrobiales bacterium]